MLPCVDSLPLQQTPRLSHALHRRGQCLLTRRLQLATACTRHAAELATPPTTIAPRVLTLHRQQVLLPVTGFVPMLPRM